MGHDLIFRWVEGETLGDTFLLRERLGRGSYGVVGKAVRLKDGHAKRRGDIIALKVPFDQEIGEENLRREPDIIQQFYHENIVRVYGYHTIAGFFVIEMEFVEGHSLAEILANQSFGQGQPLATVIGWMTQAIMGLRAMGVYAHGDIKPQNILVRNDGVVKLVDFGTSRRLEDSLVSTRGQGTEEYMAPEVALDGKRVSMKSDLYSVGVVLYEIATGDVPFRSALELLQGRQLIKPREINSSIPLSFERLILRCLERDPDLRYATWDAVLEDLQTVIADVLAQEREQAVLPVSRRLEFKPEPASPLYHLDKAKEAMVAEDYAKALEHARAAVDASEGHPNYLGLMAAICMRMEYFDQAKKAYSQLLAKYDQGYPAEPDQVAYVLMKLGGLYIETQEDEKAIAALTRYLDLAPNKALAKYKLAIAYGLDGQYKRAISLLEEVRTASPDAVIVYSKLGWAYALAGDMRQALSYYNQALVIDPADLFSLFELACYYRIKGDYQRARKYLERIQRYDRSGEYLRRAAELCE